MDVDHVLASSPKGEEAIATTVSGGQQIFPVLKFSHLRNVYDANSLTSVTDDLKPSQEILDS